MCLTNIIYFRLFNGFAKLLDNSFENILRKFGKRC